MSDGAQTTASAGLDQALDLADDGLVVRTVWGWSLTLADRRDPTAISNRAMHALVRASGGAQLAENDPGRSDLAAAGIVLPADVEGLGGSSSEASHGRSAVRPAQWRGVRPDTPALPVTVFVGQVIAGSLLVEGHGGKRELLDEVDLVLIESLDAETTAGAIFERVRATLGSSCPDDEELGGRLRHLARAGCMQLRVDDRHVPAPPAPEPVEEPEPEAEVVSLGLKAELKRLSFPGRRYVRRGYRELRKVRQRFAGAPAADGATPEEPVDEPDEVLAPTAEVRSEPQDTTAVEVAPGDEAGEAGEQEAPAFDAPGQIQYLEPPFAGEAAPGAIPVYSVFQVTTGPPLSLGMLLANAHAYQDGALEERFELRRVEDPASFFADLAGREGPAVLMLSHYIWSVDHNLEVARRGKAINPELVVIHGGPSTPKYEVQCAEWFDEHADVIDVAVRGEGELTLAHALDALSSGDGGGLDLARLEEVPGLTFRHPDGRVVRTEDRDRVTDLNTLPSPYLTGEFDHLDPSAWVEVIFESNRGCPYGCTFCDWGSSTLSRIRKFDLDRVASEMKWAGERRFPAWAMGDANFGIMSRDVDVTRIVADVREETGLPRFLGFNVAKNTTKHLTALVDVLVKAGVGPFFTLALQTRDEDTLEAIQRTNISSEHYTTLASSLRRRGLPLRADIMIGLPGQTVDSLSADLQFLMDHEVPVRMWITQLLPNAPINDPEYREEWQVQADEQGVVVSTRSFTVEDRIEMLRIRHAYTVHEQFGLLRHVIRHVQWDHGVPMMAILRKVESITNEDPRRYPLLNWTMRYFDHFNAPPLGWRSFYDEVRRFLVTEFGVPATQALDSVLEMQELLMPETGRAFPASIPMRHDYVKYFQERTRPLWMGQPAATSGPRLEEYPPARFTVYADPLARCSTGTITVVNDPHNEQMVPDEFWLSGHWEMDSPLVVNQAQVAGSRRFIGLLEQVPDDLPEEEEQASRTSVRIAMARSSVSSGDAHDDESD